MAERARVTSSDLQPDRPLSGYTDVVGFIRREIALGRLLPGERLPAERKLAERIGVARETLRQALRVLEGSGQIVIVRGTAGGAIVQDNSLSPEVAVHRLREQREDLLSLVEFRGELETVAARLSAERRSSEDITRLRQAQEELLAATNKDESRRADTAFHLAVARATGNPHLVSAIESTRASMFHPVDLLDYEFIKESSHSQHQQVLEAIAEGDSDAASAAMRHHIDRSRDEMLGIIDRD